MVGGSGDTFCSMTSPSPDPKRPLDPSLTLAMGVQAQPGVYALLLGSGVSTGAGIETGWGIVQDLVRRAAIISGASEADADAARKDPEEWWFQYSGDELTYSRLLEVVGGSTQASRRGAINRYFNGTGDERKVPSQAHRAIAGLVADGYVRVIVTTNFDNLTEQALRDVGVSPQVITQPSQVRGMEPLDHAQATILKLHGDVSELTTRNTSPELSTYPPEWDDLLDRINNDYGLVISGWSGATDVALINALKRNPLRRYPLYWDGRSSKLPEAQQVLVMHRGQIVHAADADELFTSLARSVKALAAMSEPPLTTALAVAALKAAIGDPTGHVEVEELVMDAVRQCVREVGDRPVFDGDNWYGELLEANLNSARRIVSLVAAGTYYDRDRRYADLWVDAVRGLMRAQGSNSSSGGGANYSGLYPAALAVRAAGVLAMHRSRPGVVLDMMRRARWSDPHDPGYTSTALMWLHDYNVLQSQLLKDLPGISTRFAESEHLRAVTYEFVRDYFIDEDEYALASDDYEFLIALLQWRSPDVVERMGVATGLYMSQRQWAHLADLPAAQRFRNALAAVEHDDDWPMWNLLDGRDEAEGWIARFEAFLVKERHRDRS